MQDEKDWPKDRTFRVFDFRPFDFIRLLIVQAFDFRPFDFRPVDFPAFRGAPFSLQYRCDVSRLSVGGTQ